MAGDKQPSEGAETCQSCGHKLAEERDTAPWPACSCLCLVRLIERGVIPPEAETPRLAFWRILDKCDNPHLYGLTAAQAEELQDRTSAEIQRRAMAQRLANNGPRHIQGKDAPKDTRERIGRTAQAIGSGVRWNGYKTSK